MAFEGVTAAPLAWPHGWPRTTRRMRAAFRTSFAAARDDLMRELRLLGASHVVLSTNVPLRADGLPYATFRTPDDPGVAVYFVLNGEERCIPVDKWDRVHDNIRALQKTIEAIRGIERWGASQLMHAAFQGFAALPETSSGLAWYHVLGVEPAASRDEVDRAYRHWARKLHPDAGGNAEAFHELQAAYQQAQQAVR